MVERIIVRIVIIGLALCTGSALRAPEQFVIKKDDTKKKSIGAMKEECCQIGGDIIKCIPDLLRDVADMQQLATHLVDSYIQGDKESFCQKATKEQLVICMDELQALQESVEKIQSEISIKLKKLKPLILP